MNLRLSGNLTWDKIYNIDKELIAERAGGIANIASRLRIPYLFSPTDVTPVSIYLDKYDNHSYGLDSRYRLHNHPSFLEKENDEWEHFSYLDCLDIIIPVNRPKVISADLCRTTLRDSDLGYVLRLLSEVNILIIGERELNSLRIGIDGLRELVESVILRTRDTIFWYTRDVTNRAQIFPNRYIKVENNVGAGDAFVAEFLNQYVPKYYGFKDAEDTIENCISASIDMLEGQNEEV